MWGFRLFFLTALLLVLSALAGCGSSGGGETPTTSVGLKFTAETSAAISEKGGTLEVSVVLTSAPSDEVNIPVTSSDETELVTTVKSVRFTPTDWNIPQRITLTAVDDTELDGTQPVTITAGPSTSVDGRFVGLVGTLAATVLDDETSEKPSLVVVRSEKLFTTERGETATFEVSLSQAPADDVTLPIESDNVGEIEVVTRSIKFSPLNWAAPQLVVIKGVNDTKTDGNQKVKIKLGALVSRDAKFAGFDPADLEATNVDDESPGFLVTNTRGLVVSERGDEAKFTVTLQSAPTADVIVDVSSSSVAEAKVFPSRLRFTPLDWDAPHVVRVQGVDDIDRDGTKRVVIALARATSTDTRYEGIDPEDVEVDVLDDESPRIEVRKGPSNLTTERGGSAAFSIVLSTAPTDTVTVDLTSSDEKEATVRPASVTFTKENWDSPQIVTATGVDDGKADGDQPVTVITGKARSTDPQYNGVDPEDVALVNIDDDTVSILLVVDGVARRLPFGDARALATTERGGSATFGLMLTKAPASAVSISIASSDTREVVSVSPSVRFETGDVSVKTVTLRGVDDDKVDGDRVVTIGFSVDAASEPAYAALPATTALVTNLDDDSPSVIVVPLDPLVTTEAGGTVRFSVTLGAKPASRVTLPLSISDLREASVSPSSLVFETDSWSTPQTITVKGLDDTLVDGDRPYRLILAPATSPGSPYDGYDPEDFLLVNRDDDGASILVSPTKGLSTNEKGGTAAFTVRLSSKPKANVTIAMVSTNVAEGTVSPASLTFTPEDFATARSVVVTGVDDTLVDGDQPYRIECKPAVSDDPAYSGIVGPAVDVINIDDDSTTALPGFVVSPTTGLVTTESGGTASFQVNLKSAPKANVQIALTLSASAAGEISISTILLTFTPANWFTPQTVTLTGLDDKVVDTDKPWVVILNGAVSTDPGYNGLNPPDVSGVNRSLARVGDLLVSPTSGLLTTESGVSVTFSVRLSIAPTANVDVALTVSDVKEISLSPSVLRFGPGDWSVPQIVTVTGVDDGVVDLEKPWTVAAAITGSSDSAYIGRPAVNVTGINRPSFGKVLVDKVSGHVTDELGATATFTMVLDQAPLANVVVSLTNASVSEISVSATKLTFTSGNWSTPQSVVVTGLPDGVEDGDITWIINSTAASTDTRFDKIPVPQVNGINKNVADLSLLVATPRVGLMTTEAGGTVNTTLSLLRAPKGEVRCTLTSENPAEVVATPSSFVFTPFLTSVPVTLTGRDDPNDDGDQIVKIIASCIGPLSDPAFNVAITFDVTNKNNDTATLGLLKPPDPIRLLEYAPTLGAMLQLAPSTPPIDNVTVTLTSSKPAKVTIIPSTITFNRFDYTTLKAAIVYAAMDSVGDGDTPLTISFAITAPKDPAYAAIVIPPVAMTHVDTGFNRVILKGDSSGAPKLAVNMDGRVTAFTSKVTDLISPPASGLFALAYRQELSLVTRVPELGPEPNGRTLAVSISGDGRFVAFVSEASNLVPGDTNGVADAFVFDNVTKLVERVQAAAEPNGVAHGVVFSEDGMALAVTTSANNMATDGLLDNNGQRDVYLWLRLPKTMRCISCLGPGGGGDTPALNFNGAKVAFQSSFGFGTGDDNFGPDIYLANSDDGSMTWVSTPLVGKPDGFSYNPSISRTGQAVAFESLATNLVAGDTNGQSDIFLRTFAPVMLSRVSLFFTLEGLGGSFGPSLSGDGRFVSFVSNAPNWPGDTNGFTDAYLFDTQVIKTTRLPSFFAANSGAQSTFLTGDGSKAFVLSAANNFCLASVTNPDWYWMTRP